MVKLDANNKVYRMLLRLICKHEKLSCRYIGLETYCQCKICGKFIK